MSCKTKNKNKCSNGISKSFSKRKPEDYFNLTTNLEEKGRLQFFYHSPSSELPVRDILNEQGEGHKTEPHIEIGAENYIYPCYQDINILPLLRNNEMYLFLFTTCRNKNLRNYYKNRYIVGYLVKEDFINCSTHYALKGKTYLFSFEDSLPLEMITNTYKSVRHKKVPTSVSDKILTHFRGHKNIIDECVSEIKRLDKQNSKKRKTCKVLRGNTCVFQKKDCKRWITP
jgi:hypothetical protein